MRKQCRSPDNQFSSMANLKFFVYLLDSGTSWHMTCRLDFFTDIHAIQPCFIGLPNCANTVANFELTVTLGPKFIVHDVFYCPKLMCNLISNFPDVAF